MPTRTLPDGAWLAPGFIDIQVNGGGDILLNDDPTPEAMDAIARAHRKYGTTSLLPTLITDTREKMRAALDAADEAAARKSRASSESTSKGRSFRRTAQHTIAAPSSACRTNKTLSF